MADVPEAGMKVNVYGRNGAGKTTFACTFPKPLLLVGFEDGTKSVRNVKGVDFVQIAHTDEVHEVAKMLATSGKYKSVALDTATSLQDRVLVEILGLDEVPVMLSWGTVTKQQYRARSEKTREVMRKFLDLAPLGINVVVLAQEKNHTGGEDEESPTEEGDPDLIAPFIASSLGKTTCGWLQDNCDYICQAYTRVGKEVITAKIQGKEVQREQKTGKIEFCLRTQRGHPTYAAKMRANRSVELPDVIADPSYAKLLAAIRGGG